MNSDLQERQAGKAARQSQQVNDAYGGPRTQAESGQPVREVLLVGVKRAPSLPETQHDN